jgi:5-formyltetrahydrofolate cyclo-ligase
MPIKKNIRKKIRYERTCLSKAHIARLSDNFLTQWMKLSSELSYESIALYYPFDSEASTLEIIHYLHSKNKKVLLPVIQEQSNKLLFATYHSKTILVKNTFGILEPKDKEFFEKSNIDVALIPCVAFNSKLYRLGMGGGYYDRTFAEKKSTTCIGLAYSFQFVDQPFEEKHDIKMDYVVTQKGILK